MAGGNKVPEITEAEHISPERTGDNISAKKVALYESSDGINWNRAGTQFSVIIDDTTTADTVYICKASIGSATSEAVWQIAKLDVASGLIKTWADGDSLFDNVVDNVASLSYS